MVHVSHTYRESSISMHDRLPLSTEYDHCMIHLSKLPGVKGFNDPICEKAADVEPEDRPNERDRNQ